MVRGVERFWRSPDEEYRIAEEKSNGIAGVANQYVATCPGERLCTSG
jgi:hypothetical protein